MLLWLIEAGGVDAERVAVAKNAAAGAASMMQASGRIRRLVPWEAVAAALPEPRPSRRWFNWYVKMPAEYVELMREMKAFALAQGMLADDYDFDAKVVWEPLRLAFPEQF